MQRETRGFARLRHLHGLLPRQRTTRVVVQKIIARRRVGESIYEVIHSERQLCIRLEVGVCLRAYIRRARNICRNEFRAGLRVRSQNCAKRPFKLELREQSFDALLECGVVGDGLSDV